MISAFRKKNLKVTPLCQASFVMDISHFTQANLRLNELSFFLANSKGEGKRDASFRLFEAQQNVSPSLLPTGSTFTATVKGLEHQTLVLLGKASNDGGLEMATIMFSLPTDNNCDSLALKCKVGTTAGDQTTEALILTSHRGNFDPVSIALQASLVIVSQPNCMGVRLGQATQLGAPIYCHTISTPSEGALAQVMPITIPIFNISKPEDLTAVFDIVKANIFEKESHVMGQATNRRSNPNFISVAFVSAVLANIHIQNSVFTDTTPLDWIENLIKVLQENEIARHPECVIIASIVHHRALRSFQGSYVSSNRVAWLALVLGYMLGENPALFGMACQNLRCSMRASYDAYAGYWAPSIAGSVTYADVIMMEQMDRQVSNVAAEISSLGGMTPKKIALVLYALVSKVRRVCAPTAGPRIYIDGHITTRDTTTLLIEYSDSKTVSAKRFIEAVLKPKIAIVDNIPAYDVSAFCCKVEDSVSTRGILPKFRDADEIGLPLGHSLVPGNIKAELPLVYHAELLSAQTRHSHIESGEPVVFFKAGTTGPHRCLPSVHNTSTMEAILESMNRLAAVVTLFLDASASTAQWVLDLIDFLKKANECIRDKPEDFWINYSMLIDTFLMGGGPKEFLESEFVGMKALAPNVRLIDLSYSKDRKLYVTNVKVAAMSVLLTNTAKPLFSTQSPSLSTVEALIESGEALRTLDRAKMLGLVVTDDNDGSKSVTSMLCAAMLEAGLRTRDFLDVDAQALQAELRHLSQTICIERVDDNESIRKYPVGQYFEQWNRVISRLTLGDCKKLFDIVCNFLRCNSTSSQVANDLTTCMRECITLNLALVDSTRTLRQNAIHAGTSVTEFDVTINKLMEWNRFTEGVISFASNVDVPQQPAHIQLGGMSYMPQYQQAQSTVPLPPLVPSADSGLWANATSFLR